MNETQKRKLHASANHGRQFFISLREMNFRSVSLRFNLLEVISGENITEEIFFAIWCDRGLDEGSNVILWLVNAIRLLCGFNEHIPAAKGPKALPHEI